MKFPSILKTLLVPCLLLSGYSPAFARGVPTFNINLDEPTLRTYDFCSMIHTLAEGFEKLTDHEVQQAVIQQHPLEVKRKKEIACYLLQEKAQAALQTNLARYTNEQLRSTRSDCDILIIRLEKMQNNDVPLLLHTRYHINQLITNRAAQAYVVKACCIAAGISAVITWCVTKWYKKVTKPELCHSPAAPTAPASLPAQQHPQEMHQEEEIVLQTL